MAHFGLIKRKECCVLTGRGWVSVFLGVTTILVLSITSIYPFLAVNRPVVSEILVVEGWLPDSVLEKAINEFKTHNYHLFVTTGGPMSQGFYLSIYRTYAELAAATLKRLGFDEQLIAAVPAPFTKRDRTYESAVALGKWLSTSGLSIKSINIYTVGPHARRTRLLFEKALGSKVAVGIIAASPLSYGPRNWWKSSEGVRTVTVEMVAYFYTRFFFYPNSGA